MNEPEPFRPRRLKNEIPRTTVMAGVMATQHQMCLDNIHTDLVARCKVPNSTNTMDFPLHYIIAVSNSEYFRSITSLQHNARMHLGENEMPRAEQQVPGVVMVDIPANVFPTIREHMYTGTCTIRRDDVFDVMRGADLLIMTELFNEAVNFLLFDPFHPDAVVICITFSERIPEEIRRYITDYHAWKEQNPEAVPSFPTRPRMNTQKEDYLRGLLNQEIPPARLDALDCPRLEARLRNLISMTNEDGSRRNTAPPPPVRVPMPELTRAIASDLDPYKDYTSSSIVVETCPHCRLPSSQCIEVLFGPQLSHYFMRAAIRKGTIYYLEDEDDEQVAIRRNFKRLLTQLKFATAVMNGTRLSVYADDGMNPFLDNNSEQLGADPPLPNCVVEGSCAKFESWLQEQQYVWEWGYDISPEDIPMVVVNFYREGIENAIE